MSACGSGCVVRGEHVPGCSGLVEELGDVGAGPSVECRGCLPRAAEHGVLCSWCWGRLQSVVRTLPSLVEHLHDVAVPAVSSPSGRRSPGRSSRPGERILFADALVIADELHAALVEWAREISAECPGAGAVWAAGTRWSVADEDGERLPVGIRGRSATRSVVAWVVPHLEWVARQPWAADMLEDLGYASASASRRFPVEEPERRVTNIRCPRCGRLSLVVVPPAVVGAERMVRCTSSVCGAVLADEDWERARRWAVAVASAEAVDVA